MPNSDKIYAIYDVRGTLGAEIAYIAGKLVGQRGCALCDISHGWNPLGKAAWRNALGTLARVEWLHADEQPTALSNYTSGQLPCVVLAGAERYKMLLNRPDLECCQSDINAFDLALRAALDGLSDD
jgi:hypothetical protein|tara:strand:- start:1248 stop:1625 length:378 start_codon:yes stop_codon:yes gene_type:complete